MASTTPNIILLQVNGAERPIFERAAAAAVTPGDLINVTSAGLVTPIAAANTPNARMFALENPYAPDPTLTALAQAYATSDQVRYVHAQGGDMVYARLATSQTVAIGDVLGPSATAGCLAKLTVDATTIAGAPCGIAEEAVTTTGAVGRIRMRVI